MCVKPAYRYSVRSPASNPVLAHGSPPVSGTGRPSSPPALRHLLLDRLSSSPSHSSNPPGSAVPTAVDVSSGSPWGSDWRCLSSVPAQPTSPVRSPRAALPKGPGAGPSTISRPRRALRKAHAKIEDARSRERSLRLETSSFPSSSPSPFLLHRRSAPRSCRSWRTRSKLAP